MLATGHEFLESVYTPDVTSRTANRIEDVVSVLEFAENEARAAGRLR
jgi:hypothetical protein